MLKHSFFRCVTMIEGTPRLLNPSWNIAGATMSWGYDSFDDRFGCRDLLAEDAPLGTMTSAMLRRNRSPLLFCPRKNHRRSRVHRASAENLPVNRSDSSPKNR